jgi:hypothetical protein
VNRVKLLTEAEMQNRLKARDLPHNVFKSQFMTEQTTSSDNKNKKKKTEAPQTKALNDSLSKFFTTIEKPTFNIEQFKAEYPEQYNALYEKAKNDYIQFYKDSGLNDFDIEKHSTHIEHRAKELSESFYKSIKM